MKKLILFNLIIISILLSSCGSNMSITKRHFNNGYYIAYSKGKQTTHTLKEEEKTVQIKTRKSLHSAYDRTEENTSDKYSYQSPIKDNNDIVASNKNSLSKAIPQLYHKHVEKFKIKNYEYPTSQINNMRVESNNKSGDTSDDGALSLLWVIVLVLLILWAIGFLAGGFGLGGLINVLLVIALILFILWLLRIL